MQTKLQPRKNLDLYEKHNTQIEWNMRKIINLLGNRTTQLSKLNAKNRFEINDNERGTYNRNSQLKFTTKILKSSFCG